MLKPTPITRNPALASAVANRPHIFLDCDGVLADFDTYAQAYFGQHPRAAEATLGSTRFWEMLEDKGDFYRDLPLMPDARTLFDAVAHLSPTILTGCPRGNWAEAQKIAWAQEHFPSVPIITCRSADKRDHANPGDVLIDDWPQYRHRWIEMGGVFISHYDAASSLSALWAHYPDLRADRRHSGRHRSRAAQYGSFTHEAQAPHAESRANGNDARPRPNERLHALIRRNPHDLEAGARFDPGAAPLADGAHPTATVPNENRRSVPPDRHSPNDRRD